MNIGMAYYILKFAPIVQLLLRFINKHNLKIKIISVRGIIKLLRIPIIILPLVILLTVGLLFIYSIYLGYYSTPFKGVGDIQDVVIDSYGHDAYLISGEKESNLIKNKFSRISEHTYDYFDSEYSVSFYDQYLIKWLPYQMSRIKLLKIA